MARQLFLKFPSYLRYSKETYYVGACNKEAYEGVFSYPLWMKDEKIQGILITGDRCSGKTHLTHIAAQHYGQAHLLNANMCLSYHPFECNLPLTIIDDTHLVDNEWLFHFYNHAQLKGNKFILMSALPYTQWAILPDLKSRLATIPQYNLFLPDDETMTNIFQKKFNDLGLNVSRKIIEVLLRSIDRSYQSIDSWVHYVHLKAAENNKALNYSFIRSLMMNE